MEQSLKDKFARYIHKSLEKGLKKTQDAILLTEDLLDVIEIVYDMETEESGVASVPEVIRKDVGALGVTPPPAPSSLVHKSVATDPGEGKGVILMPGDPGYAEAKPPDAERKVFSAGSVKRRALVNARRPSNLTETPKWADSELIALVNENTPEFIDFEPEGMPGVSLRAHKNVLNQAGLGSVLLTYKHAAVGDNMGSGAVEGQGVSLGLLVARVPFSVYDETQDIENALEGPKGVKAQLKGMYKARPETMEPSSQGEALPLGRGGLRFDTSSLPMGDHHEEHFTHGLAATSDPHADRGSDSILREAMKNLAGSNSRLVPPGREARK